MHKSRFTILDLRPLNKEVVTKVPNTLNRLERGGGGGVREYWHKGTNRVIWNSKQNKYTHKRKQQATPLT